MNAQRMAALLTDEAHADLATARAKLVETKAIAAEQMRAAEGRAAKLERLRNMTEVECRVDAAIKHIRENILTLRCPRCTAAFVEYNGCAALACYRCHAGVCGLCLKDCGKDAHVHVADQCALRVEGGYYVPKERWEAIQKTRKEGMLVDYVGALGQDERAAVCDAIRADVTHLGLNMP